MKSCVREGEGGEGRKGEEGEGRKRETGDRGRRRENYDITYTHITNTQAAKQALTSYIMLTNKQNIHRHDDHQRKGLTERPESPWTHLERLSEVDLLRLLQPQRDHGDVTFRPEKNKQTNTQTYHKS